MILIRSWDDAKLVWNKKNKRPARNGLVKLHLNTWLRKEDTSFVVRFHNTDIAQFYPDGTAIYFHGGYITATTKDRLNSLLPGRGVSQVKGVWYLDYDDQTKTGIPFINGMVRHPDGLWAHPVTGETITRTSGKEQRGPLEKITKYAKQYVEAMLAGRLEDEVEDVDFGDLSYLEREPAGLTLARVVLAWPRASVSRYARAVLEEFRFGERENPIASHQWTKSIKDYLLFRYQERQAQMTPRDAALIGLPVSKSS